MEIQEKRPQLASFRPMAYRRADGSMFGEPQPGQKIPPPIEEKPVVLTEMQEPVIVELSILEHFDAIIAKLPSDIDEEKQRLLDIARDEVESVKRTVNRALTYGT